MRLLPPILANLVLLAAAIGYGRSLRPLFPRSFSPLDRSALVLLGGSGLLGTLLFVVGQIWFSTAAVVVVLLVGILFAVRPIVDTAKKRFAKSPQIKLPILPAIPVVVVACVLLVTALGGLAEPTGDTTEDSIAYHFLGPRVWLRDQVIRPVADECLTAFPAVVETQYAALMVLGGQRAPNFFSVLGLVSIALVAASLALRMGLDLGGAWWVAALILTMPALCRGAYGGFIDVVYSGFVLAAARIGLDAQHGKQYALFGVFCGLALGTKYNALFAVPLLALCVFLFHSAKNEPDESTGGKPSQKLEGKTRLQYLCIASAVAVTVAAPSYIRDWILLGSPVYPPPPFLLHFFHPWYLPQEAIQSLVSRALKDGEGMGRDPLSFLLLPFHLTYHSAQFVSGAGGIGLVPLVLAPFGLLESRRNNFAKAILLFAALQTVVWFATYQEPRYVIHCFVIAAIFGVLGWNYVWKATRHIGRALSVLVVAGSILYGLFMIVSGRSDDWRAVISDSFAQQRRRDEVPFLDGFDYMNRQPAVTKILVLNPFVPTYYSLKSYVKPVGRWGEHTLPEAADVDKILSELSALHISHVLDVRWRERTARLPEHSPHVGDGAWPGQSFRLPDHPPGLTLVFERDDERIYRVN